MEMATWVNLPWPCVDVCCGLLSKPQAAAEAQRCRGAAGTLTLCKTLLHLCLCSGGTVADSQVITQHWVRPREGGRPTHTRTHTHKHTHAHTHTQKHLFTWAEYTSDSPTCTQLFSCTQASSEHKEHIMSRRIRLSRTWAGAGSASGVSVPEFTVGGDECPQFKQVCAYADAPQQHVLCISRCWANAKSDSHRNSVQD